MQNRRFQPDLWRSARLSLPLLSLILVSCGSRQLIPPENSNLARVEINELQAPDYDRMEISLRDLDESSSDPSKQSFARGDESLAMTVAAGRYELQLDYFKQNELLYSSRFCEDEQANGSVVLKPGSNRIELSVCNAKGQGLDANLEIEPVLRNGKEPAANAPEARPGDTAGDVQGSDLVFGEKVDRKGSWYVADGAIHFSGKKIQLKGINWFGLDSDYHGLHGLWSGRSMQDFLEQIKSLGFNALRIPVAPESLRRETAGADGYANPVEQIKDLLARTESLGLYILLDFHTCSSSVGHTASGPESCSGYSSEDWLRDLKTLTELSLNHANVVGVDLFNEPYGLTWTQWRDMASEAAAVVLTTNPRLLAFVEGVGGASEQGPFAAFWGENLYEAATNLPDIPKSRLVFSPHVYGPSVFDGHSYFAAEDYPNNMPQIWDSHFGYLKDRSYPLAIGEFGGKYQQKDRLWQNMFVQYLQDRDIQHFFYWSWNPNSGDTGGLLKSDWSSVDEDKLALLSPLLNRP